MKFLLPSLLFLSQTCYSVRYKRCELARELVQQHEIPRENIGDWICLVQHESNYNSGMISPRSRDGSRGHGMFQISDLWWCSEPRQRSRGNACKRQCKSFRDSNLDDDISCAKKIFSETQKLFGNGFNAWDSWNTKCKGRNLDSYVEGCFTENDEGDPSYDDYPHSVEFSPNLPANPTSLPRKPKESPPSILPISPPANYPGYPSTTPSYSTVTSRYPPKVYPQYPVETFQCQGSTMECQYFPGQGQYDFKCKRKNVGLGKWTS